MDLKQLEYFLHVEECGSFSAAATMLHIAQPSLSRQIRLLETELRHNLFIRHGRGVLVTEPGRVLVEQAKQILRQVELAREALNRLQPGLSGHLAIGMPSSLVGSVGVPLLAEFRKCLPGVGVSISDGLSISLQEWLLGGRLDIALVYKPLPSADVTSIFMIDEELLLFSHASLGAPTGPIALAAVAGLPLIMPRKPHEIRTLTEREMAVIGCKPRVELEVDSIPAILNFLGPSGQFAILPRYAVSIYSDPDTFVGRQIVDPGLVSKLVLASAAKRVTSVLCDAAIKLILRVCERVLEPIKSQECARTCAPAVEMI